MTPWVRVIAQGSIPAEEENEPHLEYLELFSKASPLIKDDDWNSWTLEYVQENIRTRPGERWSKT